MRIEIQLNNKHTKSQRRIKNLKKKMFFFTYDNCQVNSRKMFNLKVICLCVCIQANDRICLQVSFFFSLFLCFASSLLFY